VKIEDGYDSKVTNRQRLGSPHAVATIDIEVPLSSPRNLAPQVQYRCPPSPRHINPFQLDTVLFSLFYPASADISKATKAKPKHPWISRPTSLSGQGYARFAHTSNWVVDHVFTSGLYALAGSVYVHAAVDLPLLSGKALQERDLNGTSDGRLPIIVFSHGMASGRTSYTHLLGELASRGFVVAAIEHRDGSGPGTIVMHADGSQQRLMCTKEHDLMSIGDDGSKQDVKRDQFKHEQIEFRNAEIEEVVQVLQRLNAGDGGQLFKQNPRGEGEALAGFQGRLDLNNMVVGGHSFGAVSALRALRSTLHFKGGIVLDTGKESGPLNTDIDAPVVIINSDSWSCTHSIFFGRPHFDVVRDIAEGINSKQKTSAWFLTSMKTTHPSCTDAPVIAPTLLSWATGSTVDAKAGVGMYVQTCWDFLRFVVQGKVPEGSILGEEVSHKSYDVETELRSQEVKSKWHKMGWDKMWQVHVAPMTKEGQSSLQSVLKTFTDTGH